jgi:hypothetical protein
MAKKLSGFAAEFAKQRAALGAGKTFTYNGKSYSTNRADDKPTNASASTAPKNRSNSPMIPKSPTPKSRSNPPAPAAAPAPTGSSKSGGLRPASAAPASNPDQSRFPSSAAPFKPTGSAKSGGTPVQPKSAPVSNPGQSRFPSSAAPAKRPDSNTAQEFRAFGAARATGLPNAPKDGMKAMSGVFKRAITPAEKPAPTVLPRRVTATPQPSNTPPKVNSESPTMGPGPKGQRLVVRNAKDRKADDR